MSDIIFNQLKQNLSPAEKLVNSTMSNLPAIVGINNLKPVASVQSAINNVNNKINGASTIAAAVGSTISSLGLAGTAAGKIINSSASSIAGARTGTNTPSAISSSPTSSSASSVPSPVSKTSPADQMQQKKSSTSSSETLIYPVDLEKVKTYISLIFQRYERPGPDTKPTISNTHATIYLPLPESLRDSHSMMWDDIDIGIVEEIIGTKTGKNIGDILKGNKEIGYDDLKNLFEDALKLTASSYRRSGVSMLNTFHSGAGDVYNQLDAKIPNPYGSVFFKGLRGRSHAFSWKFSPKNEKDSEALKKIIKTIKYYVIPKKSEGSFTTYLDYPDMIKPEIKGDPGEKNWLYNFKYCACQSLNINFAADGSSCFHSQGAPVAVQIDMELKEIEYYLQEDVV